MANKNIELAGGSHAVNCITIGEHVALLSGPSVDSPYCGATCYNMYRHTNQENFALLRYRMFKPILRRRLSAYYSFWF